MRFVSFSPLIIVGMLAVFGLAAWAQDRPRESAPPVGPAAQPAPATPPAPTAALPDAAVSAAARAAGEGPQDDVDVATMSAPGDAAHDPGHTAGPRPAGGARQTLDFMSMVFVFMLSTFIGIGVIRRVSRLLHTPLMSLTNAISAIAVVGAIIVAGMEPHAPGTEYPVWIRTLGAVAVFASMTNIISGFLITDRMLKMFKAEKKGGAA